jgi:phosphoglycolate phosphatase
LLGASKNGLNIQIMENQNKPQNAQPFLLFDFDGTICDSFEVALQIYPILAKEFRLKDKTRDELRTLRDYPAREAFKQLGVTFWNFPKILLRARHEMSLMIDCVPAVDGMIPVLHQLKDKGFTMGVLTTNSKTNVDNFCEKNQLQLFSTIMNENKMFGKSYALKRFLSANKMDSSQVIYIGDEVSDIEACKKMGVRCVSVTWGFNSRTALTKAIPDALVERPEQILTFFDEVSA